jgi:hypothetical protein
MYHEDVMSELQGNWRNSVATVSLAAVCLTGCTASISNGNTPSAHWDIGVACEAGTEAEISGIDGVGPASDTGQVFVDCESQSGRLTFAPEAMDVAGSGRAPQRILGCANLVTVRYAYNANSSDKQRVSLIVSRGEIALSGIVNITKVGIMHSSDGCKKPPVVS